MQQTKTLLLAATLGLGALGLGLLGCTTVDYTSPAFPDAARAHREIAVLPVEMIFTGIVPNGLTARDIEEIEEGESLAFQYTFYNYLLNRSSLDRRHPILISIQPIEMTNQRLEEAGLGVRESWARPASELAELLGVDAVVRTRVRKTRYLSDLASFGVNVGLEVARDVTDGRLDWLLPWAMTKTYDVFAEGELLTADDGALLWKVAVHRTTDWSRPANDVVRGITRKLAKKFPYRAPIGLS